MVVVQCHASWSGHARWLRTTPDGRRRAPAARCGTRPRAAEREHALPYGSAGRACRGAQPPAGGHTTSGGRLAQRESASFTPRRSLVRSQYRPPSSPASCDLAAGRFRSRLRRTTCGYSNLTVQHQPHTTDTGLRPVPTTDIDLPATRSHRPATAKLTGSETTKRRTTARPERSSIRTGRAVTCRCSRYGGRVYCGSTSG